MINLVKKKIIFLLLIIISSCDCLQQVQGIIIDEDTRLPITAQVYSYRNKTVEDSVLVDSLGDFKILNMTGTLFSCPKVELLFTKIGYIDIVKKYKSCCTENDTIFMSKKTNYQTKK